MGCFASKPNPEGADEKLARHHEVKKEWAQAEAVYRQILDKRRSRGVDFFHIDYVKIELKLRDTLMAQDPNSTEAEDIRRRFRRTMLIPVTPIVWSQPWYRRRAEKKQIRPEELIG